MVGAYWLIMSLSKPASSGIPGPGDSTILSKACTIYENSVFFCTIFAKGEYIVKERK